MKEISNKDLIDKLIDITDNITRSIFSYIPTKQLEDEQQKIVKQILERMK